MTEHSVLPGLWPIHGDGVLARQGDLVLLIHPGGGVFTDRLLDLLADAARARATGLRFADLVSAEFDADAAAADAADRLSSGSGLGDAADIATHLPSFSRVSTGSVSARICRRYIRANRSRRTSRPDHGDSRRKTPVAVSSPPRETIFRVGPDAGAAAAVALPSDGIRPASSMRFTASTRPSRTRSCRTWRREASVSSARRRRTRRSKSSRRCCRGPACMC